MGLPAVDDFTAQSPTMMVIAVSSDAHPSRRSSGCETDNASQDCRKPTGSGTGIETGHTELLSYATTTSVGRVAQHACWFSLLVGPRSGAWQLWRRASEQATGDECAARRRRVSWIKARPRVVRATNDKIAMLFIELSPVGMEVGKGQGPQQARWSPCDEGCLLVRFASQVAPRACWRPTRRRESRAAT